MSVTKTPAPKRNLVISSIDKGIPIPAAKASGYPLEAMEVGDSFQVSGTTVGGLNRSISSWLKNTGHERKFDVRSIGGGALRAWRIS